MEYWDKKMYNLLEDMKKKTYILEFWKTENYKEIRLQSFGGMCMVILTKILNDGPNFESRQVISNFYKKMSDSLFQDGIESSAP